VGDIAGGFAGDLDPVMAKERLEGAREKEIERGVAGGQVGDGNPVHGLVELGVEVLDPELVEVADAGAVGKGVGGVCDSRASPPSPRVHCLINAYRR
jgi:hypothetical protein